MANPILQMLSKNSHMSNTCNIINMMNGQNPDLICEQMMKTNPRFAQFVSENRGKTAEQIMQENGINPDILKQLLR